MKYMYLLALQLLSLFFLSGCSPLYEIRGESPLLDSNMSYFLHQWRVSTIEPIRNKEYSNIYLNNSTTEKTVALTFDDSPDEVNTALILDILKSYKIQASFFMIGSTMNDHNATLAKRAFDEGHLVLNHSYSHPHFTKIDSDKIVFESTHTSQIIESITGNYPVIIRPPYGDINPIVMSTLNSQGFTTVLWSLDSLDWAIKNPDAIFDNVKRNIRNGDIILMHSGRSNHASVEALPMILNHLQKEGYSFLRVDELLGIRAYR